MAQVPRTETTSELASLLAPDPRDAAPGVPSPAPQVPAPREAPDPHAEFLARRRFGSLDGLRAGAIAVVVAHHVAGTPGRVGANLFFLISGFLITTLLVRERERSGTIAVTGFRIRRALRLFPLYFAVLALHVAVVSRFEPPGPARAGFFENLPAFATLTTNLFVPLDGERVIFYFAWSLAAQEQFYLVWPWVLKRVRHAHCALALGAILAVVYATRAHVLDEVLVAGSAARAIVTSLMPALLLGSLIALVLRMRPAFQVAVRLLGSPWASAVGLLVTAVFWWTPAVPEPALHASLAVLLIASVLREDHVLAPALHWRPIAHAGAMSYGIYLLHMLCHHVVQAGLRPLGLDLDALDFLGTLLLSIGVATLSQRHFETFFLRFRPGRATPAHSPT